MWRAHHPIAEAFLDALERGDELFVRATPPHARGAGTPKDELTPARRLEDRQLDPELIDWSTRLPFLDPRPDEPEQLGGAAERMTNDRLALFGIA